MRRAKAALFQSGFTLLELVLVLAVISTFVILGLQFYQGYQAAFTIRQLQSNVDQLFQAMSNYYKANCAIGALSPNPANFNTPYPASTAGINYSKIVSGQIVYVPIDIAATLATGGYLTNWVPVNNFVDPTGGESGYVVQFNPVPTTIAIPVGACVPFGNGQICTPATPTSTIPSTQATIIQWRVQVAVKINKPSNIQTYAAALGADCISGQTAGSNPATVDACPSANPAQNYLVWQRSPSYATIIQNGSIFAASLPLLQSFNNQYTHDANDEFNSGYSTTTVPAQAPVYYLCGG